MGQGGCSGVFVFYLHMSMGEIHWREEGDLIEIFFYVRDTTLFHIYLYLFVEIQD